MCVRRPLLVLVYNLPVMSCHGCSQSVDSAIMYIIAGITAASDARKYGKGLLRPLIGWKK